MRVILVPAAIAAASLASAVSAAPLPFIPVSGVTGASSGPAAAGVSYDAILGTVNGVGFTMTGVTLPDDRSPETAAEVQFDANGFGVDGVTGDADAPGGVDAETNPVSAGPATIDGVEDGPGGVERNELLRIVFDTPVNIFGLDFNLLDEKDDVFLAIDGTPVGRFGFGGDESLNFGGLDLLDGVVITGTTLDIMAGFPNEKTGGGGENDLFQIQGADVAPVPLPAALPMLAAALGAAGWIGRRRSA